MTDSELEMLLRDAESDRVERKEIASDLDKIRQTICAFANDMAGNNKPGVLFIGVNDAGVPTGLTITDELMLLLGGIRAEGKILPIPTMSVEKRQLLGKDVAVVIVPPAFAPPVRFDGRVWIRVGPRRAIAGADEERRLNEKRQSADLTYDETPVRGSMLSDLNVAYFREDYLKLAVAAEVLLENGRSIEHQLSALRFIGADGFTPTAAGIIVLGFDPRLWVRGAYIQFVRFEGTSKTSPIRMQRKFDGSLRSQLQSVRDFLPLAIETSRWPVENNMEHEDVPDYPETALREAVFNAVMHRNFATSNAPVSIYWFTDRVEIDNPGGPFGRVTQLNYEYTFDCRNPVIAEAMKTLKFVERFGLGVSRIKSAMERNGNPPAEFRFEPETTCVTLRARPKPWTVPASIVTLSAQFNTPKG